LFLYLWSNLVAGNKDTTDWPAVDRRLHHRVVLLWFVKTKCPTYKGEKEKKNSTKASGGGVSRASLTRFKPHDTEHDWGTPRRLGALPPFPSYEEKFVTRRPTESSSICRPRRPRPQSPEIKRDFSCNKLVRFVFLVCKTIFVLL
jgi:hypothetical protein